ncbi:MAG: hypothetical protein LBN05_00795 [Oscillospiraceae bacterium]|jgi:hypothetical protein|nr:hypothetical protein [Oscillospiraceae bacterium]
MKAMNVIGAPTLGVCVYLLLWLNVAFTATWASVLVHTLLAAGICALPLFAKDEETPDSWFWTALGSNFLSCFWAGHWIWGAVAFAVIFAIALRQKKKRALKIWAGVLCVFMVAFMLGAPVLLDPLGYPWMRDDRRVKRYPNPSGTIVLCSSNSKIYDLYARRDYEEYSLLGGNILLRPRIDFLSNGDMHTIEVRWESDHVYYDRDQRRETLF